MDWKSLVGKVIRFNHHLASDHEMDFVEGQKATILNVDPQIENDIVKILIDFSKYEEENNRIAPADYFDSEHKPTLKWCETKYYPKDKRATIYVDPNIEKYPLPFDILEEHYPTVEECLEQLMISWNALKSVHCDILEKPIYDLLVRAGKLGKGM